MFFNLQSERYYEFDPNPYENLIKKVRGFVIDKRTTDNPLKIPVYFGKPELAKQEWYGKGERHRVVNGWITRDLPIDLSLMEVNSLDEFNDLIKLIPHDIKVYGEYEYRLGEEYIKRIMILDGDY